jgi:hypothetical protein
MDGVKHDAQKPRWDLVPWSELADVVDVLTDGASKYAPDNWKRVENAQERYFAAALRHLTAWREGVKNDAETERSHLAHATCCLLFMAWFDKEHV